MYQGFFALRELPFELTSNPGYLYLTRGHAEALSNLEYGLSTAKAVTLLTGEAGTGKTTLLKAALASERCLQVRAVSINNPTLGRAEFIELLARRFSLSPLARQSKVVMLEELESILLERRGRGEISALVIDEAQSVSPEMLEEIRLLANIETPRQKLLPLVLAGQPELALRLEDAGLRHLKQRVALRCEISPLTLPETALYIATRIKAAGGVAAGLFTREAVMLVHDYARGIPRTISVICDNALTSAFALGRKPVDASIVREVGADFRLHPLEAGPSIASKASSAADRDLDPDASAAPLPAREGPHSEPSNAGVEQVFRLLGGRRR